MGYARTHQDIEERLRDEIAREARRIEALRNNPRLLVRKARRHSAEAFDQLDAALARARAAIDALSTAADDETAQLGREFGLAWRELKSELRAVACA